MQFPFELKLQPSRLVMASVLVAHLAAALALFHVPALGDVVDGEASFSRILAAEWAHWKPHASEAERTAAYDT